MKQIYCVHRFGFDFCQFYGFPVHFGACRLCPYKSDDVKYDELDFDTDVSDFPF